jgi:hypothetical protein
MHYFFESPERKAALSDLRMKDKIPFIASLMFEEPDVLLKGLVRV